MAKKLLTDSVTQDKDGTWRFACPVTNGCGIPGGPGFISSGWPTRKIAEDRGQGHFDEHITAADPNIETRIAPDLATFRAKHNLQVDPATGVVTVADLS